ncbi:MAG: ABC transporter ATP-binding protein [Lachnospiraceae bacterium]
MAEKQKMSSKNKRRSGVENPGRVFSRLVGYMFLKYPIHLIAVVIFIIAGVMANIQGTLFIQTLIDSYITPLLTSNSRDFSGLAHALIRVAVFYMLGVVSTYIYSLIMIYVSQGTLLKLRDDMFAHMEKLPIKYFDTHSHGAIMSTYTNDTDTLRQMIGQSIPLLVSSTIMVCSVTISMFLLSIPLSLLTFAFVGFMLAASKTIAGKSGGYFMEQQKNLSEVNGYIEEIMEGQKVVKVFCHEKESIEKFKEVNNRLFDSAYQANKFANILMPVIGQMGNISYVACAIIGGLLALYGFGGFTVGALASFLSFNKSFNMPINQISQQLNAVVMALAGADRVFRLMDEAPEEDGGSYQIDLGQIQGKVVFEHVDFGYQEDKMVLHDLSLYAEPGQKIAFVGSTGAGKTTITNLINRFYDIQGGIIRYDGVDINDIKKDSLRGTLGIVLQDTHLFTETVMENIRYGKLDATDEEVKAAAKLANADGFIRRLPEGYQTVLSGDGANLSQGQRQLLAIARAAIADPPVLILDEATSSIDTRTEKIVQDGMDKLMHGRTTFVIAHRLSTVKNSDCIVVLEQGRIIEKGTHDELLLEKGKYFQLYTGNAITAS